MFLYRVRGSPIFKNRGDGRQYLAGERNEPLDRDANGDNRKSFHFHSMIPAPFRSTLAHNLAKFLSMEFHLICNATCRIPVIYHFDRDG